MWTTSHSPRAYPTKREDFVQESISSRGKKRRHAATLRTVVVKELMDSSLIVEEQGLHFPVCEGHISRQSSLPQSQRVHLHLDLSGLAFLRGSRLLKGDGAGAGREIEDTED
jgi:hypothetical protein